MESTLHTDPRPARFHRLVARVVAGASVKTLVAATIAGVAAQQVTQRVLDGFYARSGYPVPYYTGQLSFSATDLERYYATMQDHGTLDVHLRTQVVDFAFIAATAFLFVSSLLLVARAFAPRHPGRRIVTALVPLALVAPVFDSLENLCSFVMVANPTSISSPLALVYSTMAAIKFAGFAAVYGIAAVGLVGAALSRRRLAPVPALGSWVRWSTTCRPTYGRGWSASGREGAVVVPALVTRGEPCRDDRVPQTMPGTTRCRSPR